MTLDDARELLQVDADADADDIRRAYLRAVKAHPPERDPEAFRSVREAFELCRDGYSNAAVRDALERPHPIPNHERPPETGDAWPEALDTILTMLGQHEVELARHALHKLDLTLAQRGERVGDPVRQLRHVCAHELVELDDGFPPAFQAALARATLQISEDSGPAAPGAELRRMADAAPEEATLARVGLERHAPNMSRIFALDLRTMSVTDASLREEAAEARGRPWWHWPLILAGVVAMTAALTPWVENLSPRGARPRRSANVTESVSPRFRQLCLDANAAATLACQTCQPRVCMALTDLASYLPGRDCVGAGLELARLDMMPAALLTPIPATARADLSRAVFAICPELRQRRNAGRSLR